MPRGTNAPKLWPAEPREVDAGSCRRAGRRRPSARVTRRAEHRADGAVDVLDRQLDLDLLAVLDRRRGQRDELLVERAVEAVVLRLRAVAVLALVRVLGLVQDRREVEAVRLPVVDGGRMSSTSVWPIASAIERKPSAARYSRTSSREELEEVHDELGLAGEPLAQLGVLRRDADRAGVEVADAHHHAAAHDERRGGEAELLAAEQRGDHDVAAGLQLAVDLHDDAVAQAVRMQRLLRLGEPELPRRAGVLDRRERRRAGAAVVAAR